MENFLEQKTQDEIDIEPTGSFLEIDANGYVINPASIDKIQEKWKPAVDEVVDIYKREYGEHLKSVYIRGSVAKGTAIEFVSDLDTFAFVDLQEGAIERGWRNLANQSLKKEFPFIESVSFAVSPVEESHEKNIFLNQSVCVYGNPVEVIPLKPGRDLIRNAKRLDQSNQEAKALLESDADNDRIKSKCRYYMKELLRSASEITLERSGKYSRDLYKCYEIFSQYYPEKENEAREVLYLALNPTADKKKLEDIVQTFGVWLENEAKGYI